MRNADIDDAVEELSTAVKLAIDTFLVKKIDSGNTFRNLPDNVLLMDRVKSRTLRAFTRESRRSRPREEILELLKFRPQLVDKETLNDIFHRSSVTD